MGGIRQTEFDVGWRVRVGLEVQTSKIFPKLGFIRCKKKQEFFELIAILKSCCGEQLVT
jgi:hypothetical protein